MPDAERLTDERVREFAAWLTREMPPGTVIGNPEWWAVRIWSQLSRLAARAGDREGEGIAGRVIVWNGVPQNGSFSSNPEAFERTRDGIEGDTFLWPEDSEIVPARLFVDRAAPGGETRKEANDG